jgi:hypothetical protein
MVAGNVEHGRTRNLGPERLARCLTRILHYHSDPKAIARIRRNQACSASLFTFISIFLFKTHGKSTLWSLAGQRLRGGYRICEQGS